LRFIFSLDSLSRGLALLAVLIFLVGTAVGSVLPEFGNLLAQRVGVRSHQFNGIFLALGIAGIGMALYLGYTRCGTGS